AKPSDIGGPVAVGKQAIVADAVEAVGEDMQEEAADELIGLERHRLPAIGSIEPIILPAESDATLIGSDPPPVRDGDAMCVARQVAERRFRSGERLLGVNDPFELPQRRKKGAERSPAGEICMITEELQLVGVMRLDQLLQKEAAEEAREHTHGQEEGR